MNYGLDGLLIHPLTKKRLEGFLEQPNHALLISGPAGSGKKFTAKNLASLLLGDTADISSHPYFYSITRPSDKSEISIDTVRQLINKFSLRVPDAAGSTINRVAVIEDAHNLSLEAQNALLKLLEEPPAGTLLVLTAPSPYDLLPTVVSRMQKINVAPVNLEESLDYFGKEYPAARVQSEWQLSQGAPGLLYALLTGESHPLKEAVDKAKHLLALDTYRRISYLQQIAKNRNEFLLFIDALSKILAVLHSSNIKKKSTVNARKLLKARQAAQEALVSVESNANLRLAALALALDIPL